MRHKGTFFDVGQGANANPIRNKKPCVVYVVCHNALIGNAYKSAKWSATVPNYDIECPFCRTANK